MVRASKAGSADASFDLAICYEKGAGIEKNDEKAFKYYVSASTLGDLDSLYEVGRCLYYGIGVEKNRSLATYFFDKWDGKIPVKGRLKINKRNAHKLELA